jgi:hypothetical protein
MLDVRDVGWTICGTITCAIRTSLDSIKKEKKVGDFESARPHYCFFLPSLCPCLSPSTAATV